MSKPPSKRPKRVVANNYMLVRTNPGFKFPIDGEVIEETADSPENAAKAITEMDWESLKGEIDANEAITWFVIDMEQCKVFKVAVFVKEVRTFELNAKVI